MRVCSVPGCTRKHKGRGFCSMHMRRKDPLRSQRGRYARTAEHRATTSAGLRQAWAEGRFADRDVNPLTGEAHPQWRGDEAGYSAAHVRLQRLRGSASTYVCAECDSVAAEWALNRDRAGSDLRVGDEGHGVLAPYSLDPWSYDPLCVGCHRRRDARQETTR